MRGKRVNTISHHGLHTRLVNISSSFFFFLISTFESIKTILKIRDFFLVFSTLRLKLNYDESWNLSKIFTKENDLDVCIHTFGFGGNSSLFKFRWFSSTLPIDWIVAFNFTISHESYRLLCVWVFSLPNWTLWYLRNKKFRSLEKMVLSNAFVLQVFTRHRSA